MSGIWPVRFHPALRRELRDLRARASGEADAIGHAIDKLAMTGPSLGHPHSSAVRAAGGLRELRPRAGHAPWRVIYCTDGTAFLLLALAPHDRRGFRRAVGVAITRQERWRA